MKKRNYAAALIAAAAFCRVPMSVMVIQRYRSLRHRKCSFAGARLATASGSQVYTEWRLAQLEDPCANASL